MGTRGVDFLAHTWEVGFKMPAFYKLGHHFFEQVLRLPFASREEFVVGTPVLLFFSVKTQGAGNGSFAHSK